MKHIFEEKGPIGAVVREADHIFSNITRKSSSYGAFNRLEWHFFNLLKERKQVTVTEVIDYLSFLDSGACVLEAIDRFKREGLVKTDAAGMKLSQKGGAVFEEVTQMQDRIKEKSLQGVSAEAYGITMDTLQQIIENVKEFLPQQTDERPLRSSDGLFGKVQEKDMEEQKIRQLITQMEQAHNPKDPELLASLFTENASFVNAGGQRLHGREIIFRSAKSVMKTFLAKSYARYEVSRISFIKKDVAIAEIHQCPVRPSGELIEDEPAGFPTYILIKDPESGNWQIITGQNTLAMKPE